MSRSDLSRATCTVARTIEIVGDAWALMILREMFLGSRRFDALQRHTGASPLLLTRRLRRFEAEGIVERRPYAERPPRHEYRLTPKGRDLWPVIVALKGWGDRWLDRAGPPPFGLRHTGCGRRTLPILVCSACGDPIDAMTARADLSADMARERERPRSHPARHD
jgi:DNA-binding HxlR family transcriptional regulator